MIQAVRTSVNWNQFADQALAGQSIDHQDALRVLRADDTELLAQLAAAYRVRHHYWGNRVRLHFLLMPRAAFVLKTAIIVHNLKFHQRKSKNIR